MLQFFVLISVLVMMYRIVRLQDVLIVPHMPPKFCAVIVITACLFFFFFFDVSILYTLHEEYRGMVIP